MSYSVTAQAPAEYQVVDGKVTAAGGDDSPKFTLQPLDFYAMQEVLGIEDASTRFKTVLKYGVLAIDGDKAKAAAFVEKPSNRYGVKVFDWLYAETLGN